MDQTLAQILNDMLTAQAGMQRLQADLEALKAEHAKCPKPKASKPVATNGHEPWVDPLETAPTGTTSNDG